VTDAVGGAPGARQSRDMRLLHHHVHRLRALAAGVAVTASALVALAPAASAAATQEYTVPSGGSPHGITTGPDGNLWLTVSLAHSVVRLTPQGVLTPFNVGFVDNAKPEQIVVGPDRALWFTDDFLLGDPSRPSAGVIHRVTTSGQVTDFPLPTAAGSQGLTVGPDGALWYTMRNPNLVGRITTAGVVTEFPLPGPQKNPGKITTGPDGALWFTQPATGTIGRLTTAGAYSEFTPPTRYTEPGGISPGITAGPDGAVWFTEFATGKIGRIGSDGRITEFDLPGDEDQPGDIISGPDGALWFAEGYHGHVDRMTVLGQFSSYALPSGGISDLTVGPGGIWYTRSTNLVGRLDTLAPPVVAKTVAAEPVSGVVKIRLRGARTFTTLPKDGKTIPVGAEVDTTAGRVRLTAAAGTGSTVTKTSEFYGGRFTISQAASKDAVLDVKLSGPLAGCGAGAAFRAKAKKAKGRLVWGDGKGTFRTTGKRSAATVRGTNWLVEDRCDGTTLTRVVRGVVAVRDDVKKKTVTLTAGRSYVARPKRR
jgi:streptogramin lyase